MKIDDSNREYSESEVRSFIKGLNARIANAEGTIDELKKENMELRKCLSQAIDVINKKDAVLVMENGVIFANSKQQKIVTCTKRLYGSIQRLRKV